MCIHPVPILSIIDFTSQWIHMGKRGERSGGGMGIRGSVGVE